MSRTHSLFAAFLNHHAFRHTRCVDFYRRIVLLQRLDLSAREFSSHHSSPPPHSNDPKDPQREEEKKDTSSHPSNDGQDAIPDETSEMVRQHLQQLKGMSSSNKVVEETKIDTRPPWQRWMVEGFLGPLFVRDIG